MSSQRVLSPFVAERSAWRALHRSFGVLLLGALFALLFAVGPAAAHVGLASSSPGDDEVVDGPITEMTLTFTAPVTLDGDGLEVLTADGETRKPDDARTDDRETWTFVFDEPLTPGLAGARWSANAGDGHPMGGGFEFTINPAPEPTPEAAEEATGETEPSAAASTDPGSATDEAGDDAAATTATSAPTSPGEDETATVGADSSDDAVGSADMERFLAGADNGAPLLSTVSGLVNLLTLLGVVGAIGSAAMAAFVLGTAHPSYEAVNGWMSKAAIAVMIGAVLQFGVQAVSFAGSWSGLVSPSAWGDVVNASELSTAFVLRFFGGLAIVLASSRLAALPTRAAGAALALSFGFDGHSVTEGNRLLHLVSSTVHTAAGAVWVGGLMVLAAVLIRHRRAGTSAGAWMLAARFSTVATVALLAVSVAGIAMSAMILDEAAQLWSTSWGGLLMAKVAVVALAAVAGGYNHFRLVPQLQAAADDDSAIGQGLVDRFRMLATAEGAVLVVVVALTAFLVQRSPV